QGLVTLSDVSGCYVAGITGRGEDVAFGLATVPGVKKPRARE
ncbi:ArsR family transcriptional regulator, partial [Citrobacter freundii]|nr:ArsR family transcriptional regulator [Citrobacter freundii]